MRHVPPVLGLGALLLAVGCNQVQPMRGNTSAPPVAHNPQAVPTAAQLCDYLNGNASRLQSIDCGDLDLDARERAQSVGLRGWLVCQQPKNFRMAAKIVGNNAVDMGSNSDEFWYWISKAEPPYLFHCSYQDLGTGRAQLPFPIQPEWVMEAFGMATFGPPENFKVNATQNTLELIQDTKLPQGAPATKVTVFARAPVSGNQPQVTAHLLKDASGKIICGAYVSEVQRDPTSGAVVPKRVRLEWPQQHLELKMKLDGLTVNQPIAEKRATALFTRPAMNGVKSYDLARGADNTPTGQVQRTAGYQAQ